MSKNALVCGAGGFIGSHLVKRLKRDGYWVRGADLKLPEFSLTEADDFILTDLREWRNCQAILSLSGGFDEVYQLAADMGGMGFIESAECEIMRHNAFINLQMIHQAVKSDVRRYFFSSSVCIYRDMRPGEAALTEEQAYPALPDNEYGWEKLYTERLLNAYAQRYSLIIRIARFQNCYGPEGTWDGGREKAPAALCRKAALAKAGDAIEVWGDGSAVRNYIYVDDLVDGVVTLMHSNLEVPTNIGTREYVTVDELARTVIAASGKVLNIEHIEGPVGVQSRNFSNAQIESIGWRPRTSLREGIALTYPWVAEQAEAVYG